MKPLDVTSDMTQPYVVHIPTSVHAVRDLATNVQCTYVHMASDI